MEGGEWTPAEAKPKALLTAEISVLAGHGDNASPV